MMLIVYRRIAERATVRRLHQPLQTTIAIYDRIAADRLHVMYSQQPAACYKHVPVVVIQ